MASDSIIVLVTCPPAESADLSQKLVNEKLAACVNIVPSVLSIYQWEGKLCQEQEQLLIIKSTSERWNALKSRIVELHSYEVPEVVAISIQDGHEPYLAWMKSCVQVENKR